MEHFSSAFFVFVKKPGVSPQKLDIFALKSVFFPTSVPQCLLLKQLNPFMAF